jgi:acetyl esterase/lipase
MSLNKQPSFAAQLDEAFPRPDYSALIGPQLLDPPAMNVIQGAQSWLQIRYADAVGWRPLRADLHVPTDVGAAPVVVYVHGGSFVSGLPAHGPWPSLLANGIAVLSVAYRFAGEVRFPEPVEDVRAAIRWIHHDGHKFGLDPSRVAIWGSSAGGYIAALAALSGASKLGKPVGCRTHDTSTCVSEPVPPPSALVTHYAISDPSRLREDTPGSPEHLIKGFETVLEAFFQGNQMPTDVASYLRSEAGPACLLAHGTADIRVGISQSRRLHQALLQSGKHAELIEVAGADHAAPEFFGEAVAERTLTFLRTAWTEQ